MNYNLTLLMIILYFSSLKYKFLSTHKSFHLIYPAISSLNLIYAIIYYFLFKVKIDLKPIVILILIGILFSFISQISFFIGEYSLILKQRKKNTKDEMLEIVKKEIIKEITILIDKMNIKLNLEITKNTEHENILKSKFEEIDIIVNQYRLKLEADEVKIKQIIDDGLKHNKVNPEINKIKDQMQELKSEMQYVVDKITNVFEKININSKL
jgi:hypothetical protein